MTLKFEIKSVLEFCLRSPVLDRFRKQIPSLVPKDRKSVV